MKMNMVTMPTVIPETPAPNNAVSNETFRFDYPGSDIILRSCDSHNFRVPKLYVVNSSPVLRELLGTVSNTSRVSDGKEQEPLPVVELLESGAILHSLLTFVFPVAPILPSTTEDIMKLLAVVQKYKMDSVLTHVRGVISLQDPPFILPETALHVYYLAQKNELRQEVLRAARCTLRRRPMVLENLEDEVDFMPGAHLHELWEYHESVKKNLASSLLEFRRSGVLDIVRNPKCGTPASGLASGTPQWLHYYLESLAEAPHRFDLIEFESALANHIRNRPPNFTPCPCMRISSQTIRSFWVALTAVVNEAMEEADPTLALVTEEPTPENLDPPFLPQCLDLPDANIIVRSSDQVSFPVRKSVLAMSSPFFKDLLSLPQPPDGELVDGLPVVQLSEDADLLNSLISLLHPISPVIPSSYEKVFALLAACQKYDMESVQSNIRAGIKLGRFPAPVGDEAFRAYAIASGLGLIPEMENAARLTLGHPMTFESLGEQLRSFEGRALCDLVRYRKRCRDNLVSCLDSFFDVRSRYEMWAGCREPFALPNNTRDPPTVWLRDFFSDKSVELQNGFPLAISSPPTVLAEYLEALKSHDCCDSCFRVHVREGETFCRGLEDQLAQTLDEVNTSFLFWIVKPTDLNRSYEGIGIAY
ncbi:hypothetical protein EDB85DRAFT_857867 [Lactarius pseudohatsudake]|nr:hypothetical protein EDB85DRAFT_857867 [Lactarius pseudohatsudake]